MKHLRFDDPIPFKLGALAHSAQPANDSAAIAAAEKRRAILRFERESYDIIGTENLPKPKKQKANLSGDLAYGGGENSATCKLETGDVVAVTFGNCSRFGEHGVVSVVPYEFNEARILYTVVFDNGDMTFSERSSLRLVQRAAKPENKMTCELKIGDTVRVVYPHSKFYGKTGILVPRFDGNKDKWQVAFSEKAGAFDTFGMRSSLELVERKVNGFKPSQFADNTRPKEIVILHDGDAVCIRAEGNVYNGLRGRVETTGGSWFKVWLPGIALPIAVSNRNDLEFLEKTDGTPGPWSKTTANRAPVMMSADTTGKTNAGDTSYFSNRYMK